MERRVTIIGGTGNLGSALDRGMRAKGLVNDENLIITNSKTHNNREAVKIADIVMLVVKPNAMENVLLEVGDVADQNKLKISFAAGVTIETIAKALGEGHHKIVRVMPNLGASVGESASVWTANEHVTEEDKLIVRQILGAIGKESEVATEDEVDKATALFGSGPAYFYGLVEELQNIAVKMGLNEELGAVMAKQTFIGSAKVFENSDLDAGSWRQKVTSPNGTTFAAFNELRKRRFDSFFGRFDRGVFAAYRRARELGGKR